MPPSYLEQERALAATVAADPNATPEDRASARSRMKISHVPTDDDFDSLSEFELELWVSMRRKVTRKPPVPRSVSEAREHASQARDYADQAADVAEALALGRRAPPEFTTRCRRCAEFPDDALQDLREAESELDEEEASEANS